MSSSVPKARNEGETLQGKTHFCFLHVCFIKHRRFHVNVTSFDSLNVFSGFLDENYAEQLWNCLKKQVSEPTHSFFEQIRTSITLP